MRRSFLTLSIAVVGVGSAVAGFRAPATGMGIASIEGMASGSVVNRRPDGRDDERERQRQKIREREPGTYIADILRLRDSALARWPDRHGNPLTVWIQPRSTVPDWHVNYVYEVHNAFVAWDTLRLPVRFEIIADSAEAQIHITWIDRFREPISGRTRWARDDHYWITDASITLAVHHRTGEILEDDAMHAMALHEIGHLLGLDHTGDPSSVMAPRVRVRRLSNADRSTARLLYSLPAGQLGSATRVAAAR